LPDIFLCKRVSTASGKAKNNTKGQRNKGSKGATGWCFSLLRPFVPLSLSVEKAFFATTFQVVYLKMEEIPGLLRQMSVNGI
jgi:hypothetical protein